MVLAVNLAALYGRGREVTGPQKQLPYSSLVEEVQYSESRPMRVSRTLRRRPNAETRQRLREDIAGMRT